MRLSPSRLRGWYSRMMLKWLLSWNDGVGACLVFWLGGVGAETALPTGKPGERNTSPSVVRRISAAGRPSTSQWWACEPMRVGRNSSCLSRRVEVHMTLQVELCLTRRSNRPSVEYRRSPNRADPSESGTERGDEGRQKPIRSSNASYLCARGSVGQRRNSAVVAAACVVSLEQVSAPPAETRLAHEPLQSCPDRHRWREMTHGTMLVSPSPYLGPTALTRRATCSPSWYECGDAPGR